MKKQHFRLVVGVESDRVELQVKIEKSDLYSTRKTYPVFCEGDRLDDVRGRRLPLVVLSAVGWYLEQGWVLDDVLFSDFYLEREDI